MQLFPILVAGVLVIVAQASSESDKTEGKIIASGDPIAAVGEFPHHVHIKYLNRKWHCEGSLIDPQYVLVAAHCVGGSINDLQVVVGATRLNEGTAISIKNIVIHPNATSPVPKYFGDIAVIKLSKKVTESYKIRPINLPETNASYCKGIYLEASGFGLTNQQSEKISPASDRPLLKRSFEITDGNVCKISWWKRRIIIEDSVLCVKSSIKDQCFGNSGAIFIERSNNGYPILVGLSIAAYNDNCSSVEPDIIVNVAHYVPWIKLVLASV